ncbi:MAG: porin family protein [Phycisphaerales bacterium]
MKRGLVLLSVTSLVLASVASASVQQGDTELDFAAGFVSENGAEDNGNSNSLFGGIDLGYFVTDNIQVGPSVSVGWTDNDSTSNTYGSESVEYGFGLFGKYHFMPTNQWVPYVGARIAYSWDKTDFDSPNVSDNTDEGTSYGPVAGLRFEMNEKNDFYAEYRYTLYGGDFREWRDETHAVLVGIIHQFK